LIDKQPHCCHRWNAPHVRLHGMRAREQLVPGTAKVSVISFPPMDERGAIVSALPGRGDSGTPHRLRAGFQVNEIAVAIRPAVLEESEDKLVRFDKVVAGESLSGGGFGLFGASGPKPIKPFAAIRTRSVLEQLAGTSQGMVLGGMGFPGRGPGGPPRGPGGPDGFGPGMFLGTSFLEALDPDKHSFVTRDEFTQGFVRWFEAWNSDKSGALTEEQLRAGINKDMSPFRNGPPQGFGPPPGFGPPGEPDDE